MTQARAFRLEAEVSPRVEGVVLVPRGGGEEGVCGASSVVAPFVTRGPRVSVSRLRGVVWGMVSGPVRVDLSTVSMEGKRRKWSPVSSMSLLANALRSAGVVSASVLLSLPEEE